MVIRSVLAELETASGPVGKMLRKGDDFHVLVIGFKEGMILPQHTTALPARLVVIQGEVIYNSPRGASALDLYDEYEIPVDEKHWVEARKDSIIMVIKGK